jgi:hypothetical protein
VLGRGTVPRHDGGGPKLFRLWAFVASLPLGALAAFALPQPPGAAAGLGLLAGAGLLGAAFAALAARLGDDAPDRGAHVARGASVGLAALPALAATVLGAGPPAALWLALAGAALAAALWRARRAPTAAPGAAGLAVAALAAPLAGALVVLLVVVGHGWLAPAWPGPDAALRAATLDVDSRVPLRAAPRCEPRAAAVAVLSDRGAAPRLGADGASVWFEAPAADGRLQIHRLAPGGGPICWTCVEAGNNRRPAPHPTGTGVLFDTDRFASWRSPADTEVMLARGAGDGPPRHPSRRLTHSPGPDDHALYDPGGRGLVWAHGGGGRFEILRASILSGHGGLLLSAPAALLSGRSAWSVPLAWSPDARTLVAGFGQPFAPLLGVRLDPAEGARHRVEGGLVAGSVSFSADGSVMAAATTQGHGSARLLPGALGNVLARLPRAGGVRGAGTEVALGAPDELRPVALGDVAGWGVPTGLSLLPDASGFVLGQRREGGERIVRVDLDCAR